MKFEKMHEYGRLDYILCYEKLKMITIIIERTLKIYEKASNCATVSLKK